MAKAGEVVVKLSTESAEFNAGVKRVRSSAASMVADLKKQFGDGSLWGQTGKLLAGGGAVAGLSLAASQLNNLAKGAEELNAALIKGDGSAGLMAANFLKSIPIVGDLGDAFARIYDIASGTAAYVASTQAA